MALSIDKEIAECHRLLGESGAAYENERYNAAHVVAVFRFLLESRYLLLYPGMQAAARERLDCLSCIIKPDLAPEDLDVIRRLEERLARLSERIDMDLD